MRLNVVARNGMLRYGRSRKSLEKNTVAVAFVGDQSLARCDHLISDFALYGTLRLIWPISWVSPYFAEAFFKN